MPPKKNKKKVPTRMSKDAGVQMNGAPVEQFCEKLLVEAKSNGEINLQESIAGFETFLTSLGDNEYLSTSDVLLLKSVLDRGDDKNICGRLDAPSFNIVLKFISRAEHSRDVERCLYLLASSIYSTDPVPKQGTKIYKRFDEISKESLVPLLQQFTDVNRSTQFRQWVGIIFNILFEKCEDSNIFRIEVASEACKRAIGSNMVLEQDPVVKLVGGQVLKTLMAAGIPRPDLWWNPEENLYTKFPDPMLPSSQFHKSFQSYLSEFIDSDEDQFLGFSMGVTTIPKTAATVQLPSMFYVGLDQSHFVVFIPARDDAMIDQHLEIPLKSIEAISFYGSEQYASVIQGATDFLVYLEGTKPCYLNGKSTQLEELELHLRSSEEAEDLSQEIWGANPSIKFDWGESSSKVSQSLEIFEADATRYDHLPISSTQTQLKARQDDSDGIEGEEKIIPDTYELDEFSNPYFAKTSESDEAHVNEEYAAQDEEGIEIQDDEQPGYSDADLPPGLLDEVPKTEEALDNPKFITGDDALMKDSDPNQGVPENSDRVSSSDSFNVSRQCTTTNNGVDGEEFDSIDELQISTGDQGNPQNLKPSIQQAKSLTVNISTSVKPKGSITQLRPKRTIAKKINIDQSTPSTQKTRKSPQNFHSSGSLSLEPEDASTPKPATSNTLSKSKNNEDTKEKTSKAPLKRPVIAKDSDIRSKKPKLYSLAPKPKEKKGLNSLKPASSANARDEFDFPSSDSQSVTKPRDGKGRKAPAKQKANSKGKKAPSKPIASASREPVKAKRSQRRAAEKAKSKIHDINSDEAAIDNDGRVLHSHHTRSTATDNENLQQASDENEAPPDALEKTAPILKIDEKVTKMNKTDKSTVDTIKDIPDSQAEKENHFKDTLTSKALRNDIDTNSVIPDVGMFLTEAEVPQAIELDELQEKDACELGLMNPPVDIEDLPEEQNQVQNPSQDQHQSKVDEPIIKAPPKKKSAKDMAEAMNILLAGLPDPVASPETYHKSSVALKAVQVPEKLPSTRKKVVDSPPQFRAEKKQPGELTSEIVIKEQNADARTPLVEVGNSDATRKSNVRKKRKNVTEKLEPAKKQCKDGLIEPQISPMRDVIPAKQVHETARLPDTPLRQMKSKCPAKSPQLPTRHSPRIRALEEKKMGEICTAAAQPRDETHTKYSTAKSAPTITKDQPPIDDAIIRKPAIIGFGSSGPRSQGRRQIMKKSPVKMLSSPQQTAKPTDDELPRDIFTQKPVLSQVNIAPVYLTKEKQSQKNPLVRNTVIVPFSQEDRIITISDDDDTDDNISDSTPKSPDINYKPQTQLSRIDENGSPKALVGAANNYKRIVKRLFAAPLKSPEQQKMAPPTFPAEAMPERLLPPKLEKNVSILSNKSIRGDLDIVENPEMLTRVSQRRAEQANSVAKTIAPVSKLNDPFTEDEQSVMRPPTLLTKKFQDLSKSTAKSRVPLQERRSVLGRTNRFFDDDKTLVENQVPEDLTSDSSESEEDMKLGASISKNADDWRNALKPHYSRMAAALSNINRELIMRMSREEDAIAMVVTEYRENGLKLITPVIREEEARQTFMKHAVKEVTKDLGKLYGSLSETVASMGKGVKVSEIQEEWEAKQKNWQSLFDEFAPK